MAIKACIRGFSAAALVAVCFATPVTGQGLSAEDAFRDGNRLFRDDLYWAALLRYEQAADAGMNSPALHYNIGVSHYRARQYERAARALERAAQSPRLAVLAHYNLGLTEYAAGNNAAALRWLRQARDQKENGKISSLAEKAIARLRDDVLRESVIAVEEEPVEDEDVPVRELAREPRPFSEFTAYARAGFGSDDNVYRTPSESYIDISNPNQPVQVDPVVQSGSFVPLSIGAKYLINSFEHESFFARYRGTARIYSGEELANADEQTHELAIGTEYKRDRENRQNRVFSAFTVATHDEVFFDPDDGALRLVDGIDISDRYSYLRYGPEFWTRQTWGRFSMRFGLKAQLWNYEDTEAVSEYDHEFLQANSYLQYRFTKTAMLRLTARYYQRNFSDRPAFELDGTQPVGNPGVQYEYIDYGVVARQRLTSGFWFGVKYVFTDRADNYIGYNDYTRDGFGAELHLRLGNNFQLDAEALYRIYNFTNAFAFNNPTADRKTLESADGRLAVSYDMPWNLRLVGDYTYRDVTSNDARIAFQRSLFMLSLQWSVE
ncbi:MAG: hypothetical protein AAGA44_15605 [Pseudomonadota bacterium]